MKAASRPQYYRIKRIVDMVGEGSAEGYLPSRSDFRRELEVSPRTLARDWGGQTTSGRKMREYRCPGAAQPRKLQLRVVRKLWPLRAPP